MNNLQSSCDAILRKVTSSAPRVPGVVAMVTDCKGDIYAGAAGERRLDGKPMDAETVFAIFSTTKAITGTVALQCVEEGLVDLDAPAKEYVPAIGKLQVIEGFDSNGQPRLRAPKSDVTTRQLLLHVGGFGYDFFNATYCRLASERSQPSVVTGTRAAIETPLLFDPGEKWEYGSNIDWVGQVVEGVRGKNLGAVMKERVFDRLGMTETAFTRTPDMKARTALIHARGPDGGLTPMDDFALPDNPEVEMGGHGLYGTVRDYMKFIRMWLNDGDGPSGRVLKPETVAYAVKGGLIKPKQKVTMLLRRHSLALQRRRILPRPGERLVVDLHGQRRESANWPSGRRDRLGGPRQLLLLDRSAERSRRLLGDADPSFRRSSLLPRIHRLRNGGLCPTARQGDGVRE